MHTFLEVFKSKPIQKNRKPQNTEYFWMCLDVVLYKPLGLEQISDHFFKTEPNQTEPQKVNINTYLFFY